MRLVGMIDKQNLWKSLVCVMLTRAETSLARGGDNLGEGKMEMKRWESF
jgi:hypothetical protein